MLIFSIGNKTMSLNIVNRLYLPLIQVHSGQYFRCQPITPDGCNEETFPLFKLRFRQPGLAAELNHGLGTRTNAFNITGQVERLGQKRVVWN